LSINLHRVSLASIVALFLLALACASPPPEISLGRPDATFLALGDFGTGGDFQQRIADAMCREVEGEPVRYVVTTGDNVYGSGEPEDFDSDFKEPYSCLFQRGVRFHAVLGNHDVITRGGQPEINDPAFGMPARYYVWRLGVISFIMLESNGLDEDPEQLQWMRKELARAQSSPWTIVVFHHPVFSAGTVHGPTPGFDEILARPFSQFGVDLVLNGHDHNYQHAELDGVTYVVTGGGGAGLYECRTTLVHPVKRCVVERHFLRVEATEGSLVVEALNEQNETIDVVDVPRNEGTAGS
jgi:Calcineurin-like phosphoesterase